MRYAVLLAVLNFFIAAPLALALTQSPAITATTKYFSRSATSGLNSTNNVSAEAWIKVGTVPASDGDCLVLVSNHDATAGDRGWRFFYENISGTPDLVFAFRDSSDLNSYQATVAWTATTNTWVHVAVSRVTSSVKFYVNGSQQGSTQTIDASNILQVSKKIYVAENGALSLGCNNTAPDFKQSLTRAWSNDQSANFNANKCTVFGSAQTGLLAEWTLDNVLTDGSGAGLTLTNNGTIAFSADVPSCLSSGSSNPILGLVRAFFLW